MEIRLKELVDQWLVQADPALPVVLTAHASVQGAVYGGERTVMLGSDLVLSGSLVKDPRLDYVALGHIHKKQDLNENRHPPVVYPGSIERVDFGECRDDKYFVIAHVERGRTELDWRKLDGIRPFYDCKVQLDQASQPLSYNERLRSALPAPERIDGAILRLTIEYPRECETMIDEVSLREYCRMAFEFHLIKRPQMGIRSRLPADQSVNSLTPQQLLELYWLSKSDMDEKSIASLLKLAEGVLSEVHQDD
jgi:exonuclease SbcD